VNRAFAIVDDFLDPREHLDLWNAFQETGLSPERAGDWNQVYQRQDAEHGSESRLRTPALQDAAGNLPGALRVFGEKLFALASGDQPPVSEIPWTCFSLSAWIYRPGFGLEWHSDTGWLAAYIYYMHPVWRSSWGGELLVAATDDSASGIEAVAPSNADHSRDAVEAVCRTGGAFVYPRPNRLVLLRGGTLHCVKNVERAAGQAFRASLSGFFFNADKPL
jgi:hypothetical protein